MSVDITVSEGIATVTLDRPERRNALDLEMIARLAEVWEEVRSNTAIQVAVLTGAGDRSFCAGVDLSVTGDLNPEGALMREAAFDLKIPPIF